VSVPEIMFLAVWLSTGKHNEMPNFFRKHNSRFCIVVSFHSQVFCPVKKVIEARGGQLISFGGTFRRPIFSGGPYLLMEIEASKSWLS